MRSCHSSARWGGRGLGSGQSRGNGAQVELVERLRADLLTGRDVLGPHRPDPGTHRDAGYGFGKDGVMRVLVAPDKFAGTLTAVEAAEAIADGLAAAGAGRRARPAPDVRRRTRASSTSSPPRSAARWSRWWCGGRSANRYRPSCCRVGDTAYVESAQACGLHLTGGRDAERATTYGVGELVAAAREPPASAPSWSGSAAAAPTTAAPGCSPHSARPATVPSTRASPGSPASPASTSPTPASRSSRRATSTTR